MSNLKRVCRVDGDHRIKGCPECDLIAKVELLEADAKVAVDGLLALTELFNAERSKVERLEAFIRELQDHSAARERTYNLLTTTLDGYRSKIERLEEALATSDKACGAWELECDDREKAGRAEGMEEAAKWMKRRGIHPYTVREFREWAAAKQQTGEAGSREFVSPASPSPGSASPVDSRVLLPPDRNRMCRICGELVDDCSGHDSGLKDAADADANNADFRDGGYGKESA